MKNRTSFICFVTVLGLSEMLLLVHAYTSSGNGQSAPSSRDSDTYSSGNNHDIHNHPTLQFGGFSGQKNNNQPPNHEHSNYYEPNRKHHSVDRYQNNKNCEGGSLFSREEYYEVYGYPEHCQYTENPRITCNYYVNISKERDDSEHLHFELVGHIVNPNIGGYVAVGLSEDKKMGDDHIIECVISGNGRRRDYHSWTTGHTQPERLKDDAKVYTMKTHYPEYVSEQKLLTCKFKRPIKTSVNIEGRSVEFDLERGKYFILLAVGDTRGANTDTLAFHGSNPLKNGHAYVSPNFLGYDKDCTQTQTYPATTTRSRGGQAACVSSVVIFISMLFLFYFIQ